jgi:hypothetical protein
MVSSGVPDEIPSNLTSRFAVRKAMQSTLDFAQRMNRRIGVENLDRTESTPLLSPEDFTRKKMRGMRNDFSNRP